MSKTTLDPNPSPEAIQSAWRSLQETKPGLRIRNAASMLGLREAQLLATQVGDTAIRLAPQWEAILKRLPELGRVMSLTRNDACVLEHKGPFEKVRVFKGANHHMGLASGPIETRIFLKAWHSAFYVDQEKQGRRLTSLQFFDHEGCAITKIYLLRQSEREALDRLVADFRAADQSREQAVSAYPPDESESAIQADDFLEEWSKLRDTHDFFPLLRRHRIHRRQAMKLAEGQFTQAVDPNELQLLLETVARERLPIMVFAGNRGNLQIHQDVVKNIRPLERKGHSGPEHWLNVLDPQFNMHLRMDLLQAAWVVEKPTKDGPVRSLECYDAEGRLVVQFFGLRKFGQPQAPRWHELLLSLTSQKEGQA